MAEADLSPTTFTSSSASDSDYDISLRIPLKIYTETSSDNYHQTQKAMQSLKSAGAQRCQIRSTGSSCHPVELISAQTTENNSQKKGSLFVFAKAKEQRAWTRIKRRTVTVTTNRNSENYPSRKAFATHLSDSHSSTFSDLTNGFSTKYATLSHTRFEEKGRDKKNNKAAFTVERMKFLLNFQTQKTTQEENNCRKLFVDQLGPKYGNLHSCTTQSPRSN